VTAFDARTVEITQPRIAGAAVGGPHAGSAARKVEHAGSVQQERVRARASIAVWLDVATGLPRPAAGGGALARARREIGHAGDARQVGGTEIEWRAQIRDHILRP